MMRIKRPRVAAIGLDESQVESIAPLCGELRTADSYAQYLHSYSWIETDIAVSTAFKVAEVRRDAQLEIRRGTHLEVRRGAHFLATGPTAFHWEWSDSTGVGGWASVDTNHHNTEREVTVSPECPTAYRELAADLSRQLGSANDPPPVVKVQKAPSGGQIALIETTSRRPVALRLVLANLGEPGNGEGPSPVALVLPPVANLSAWFGAFLSDIHETDPARVPQPPPRLGDLSDWYTPREKDLAERIATIADEFERLGAERERLEAELADEGTKADAGIRRAVWADGSNLVAAVGDILERLGFTVQDMDAGLEQGKPKREDLRLTHVGRPGWEAIAEVKGYPNGTKTNDARQIRQHRDRYIIEERRNPDLTLWLANPHRAMDPSSRPTPDGNVRDAARTIEAVHVLTSDLYRQWSQVASGRLQADDVIERLANAEPGLWSPLAPPPVSSSPSSEPTTG